MPENKAAGERRAHWFHILPQTSPAARDLHAARLAEKAWLQGDRVCIACESAGHAEALDDLLWQLAPDAFIPHGIAAEASQACTDPVGILLYPPRPADWDTVIILTAALPPDAHLFQRLALVAHNDAGTLDLARSQFRELRRLGIEPKVVDRRKGG